MASNSTVITEASIIHTGSDIAVATLEDEVVVLDVERGRYYGLNELGARIFQAVQNEGPVSVEDVLTRIEKEYAVESDQLLRDVSDFLSAMQGHGLLEVRNESEGG